MSAMKRLGFCFALVACGGDVFIGTDGGADGGDGGSGLTCPSSQPTAGGACKGDLTCEYGTSPNPNCDEVFACQSNAWVNQTTGTICPPTALCPATYNAVPNGQDCPSDDGLTCGYQQGECICTKSFGGLQKQIPAWDCFPAQQNCPAPRPDIGSTCTTPDQSCNYGACSGGVQLVCKDGRWQSADTLCPG
jgi:hypothetical protein